MVGGIVSGFWRWTVLLHVVVGDRFVMKKKRYLLLGRALLCGFCAYLVYTHSLSLSFSNGLRVAAVTKYGGIVEERERGQRN